MGLIQFLAVNHFSQFVSEIRLLWVVVVATQSWRLNKKQLKSQINQFHFTVDFLNELDIHVVQGVRFEINSLQITLTSNHFKNWIFSKEWTTFAKMFNKGICFLLPHEKRVFLENWTRLTEELYRQKIRKTIFPVNFFQWKDCNWWH